jgi:hypothetical protein
MTSKAKNIYFVPLHKKNVMIVKEEIKQNPLEKKTTKKKTYVNIYKMNRLQPTLDNVYENILVTPPPRKKKNFLNQNSFLTSNSLEVQEQETLEQRLYSKFQKLNLEGTTPNGLSSVPDWAKPRFETLSNLATIQEEQIKFPNVREVPTGVLRMNAMSEMGKNNLKDITILDVQNLNNLISQLAGSSGKNI